MYKFYVLPALALLGIAFAIRTVIAGSVPPPVAAPLVAPARAPYPSFVAGSGIVEARSENIAIAPPFAGVVLRVSVRPGDIVTAGQELFALDDRDLRAELKVRRAQVELARAELADAETQLQIYRGVSDPGATIRGERLKRESAVLVERAAVAQAEAQAQAAETTLDRSVIRSPIDAQVFQVKVRTGEFAPAQALATPLLMLGATGPLAVRIDVDENDAWRVVAGKPATATLRGNSSVSFPLAFVRCEPYVIPKRSLTGESNERVDTRVLQVIYSFERGELPVFVGQLVDAFIEAAPAPYEGRGGSTAP